MPTYQSSEVMQDSKQEQIILVAQKLRYSLLRMILSVSFVTSLGVLGRSVFQSIPSVEPLTSLIVFVGFLFGPKIGFVSGISGFYASNFLVWGGQGPWTVFQSIGAGVAGFVGGLFGLLSNFQLAALRNVQL